MKKQNTAQKYFEQKALSLLDWLFMSLASISLIAGNFISGAATAGIILTAVFLIAFYFSRLKRVKDSDIDELTRELLQESKIFPDSKSYICTYDLTSPKIRKGKDGKIRSDIFVVSKFTFGGNDTDISVWRFDLLEQKATSEKYTVPKGSVDHIENKLNTSFGEVKVSLLSSSFFTSTIPALNKDLATSEIIDKLNS